MIRWQTMSGAFALALTLTVPLAASAMARDPEPLPQVSRVTAGDTHTCANWWYGSSCWGDNDQGKLGNGTAHGLLLAPLAPPTIVPEAVFAPRTATVGWPFDSLEPGPTRTCALATGQAGTTAGEVWCWGDYGLGRVCWAGSFPSRIAPGVVWKGPPGDDEGPHGCGVAPLAPVFSVAVAEHRVCSLVGSPYDGTGGEVWCWDEMGGQAELLAHPLAGPGGDPMTGITAIDGAFDGFCGISVDGVVWCWNDRDSEPPARVAGVTDAVAVAVGGDHACAQVRDGSVWCWGANDRGQLGDGTTTPTDSAVRVVGLDETSSAGSGDPSGGGNPWMRGRRILSAGHAHTCVFRDEPDGDYEHAFERADAVFCWGANDRGQLGDGSRDDRSSPVRVADLDPALGVFDLALGRSHSCTVTGESASVSHSDPTMGGIGSHRMLRCWGANEHGQLGTGDRDDRSRPSVVVMTEEPRLDTFRD